MATLILTVIGNDRAGLVDSLSGVVEDHEGNWNRSHLARLGGKFAGIVEVEVSSRRSAELTEALLRLGGEGLLEVTVSEGSSDMVSSDSHRLTIDLIGQDHPGIVHDLSHAVAASEVSILELNSETRNAPMGGGSLFHADVVLDVPNHLDEDALIDTLEELAEKLMVDIEFDITNRGI